MQCSEEIVLFLKKIFVKLNVELVETLFSNWKKKELAKKKCKHGW